MKSLLVLLCLAGPAFGQMMGGYSDQEVTDPDMVSLAWQAVPTLNSHSNSYYHFVPSKILSVQSQVVAGTNYKFEIEMAESSCNKNTAESELTAENCAIRKAGKTMKCKLSVFMALPDENGHRESTFTHKGCSPAAKPKKNKQRKSDQKLKVVRLMKGESARSVFGSMDHGQRQNWEVFQGFVQKYNKTYTGGKQEYFRRFNIFHRNSKVIKMLQKNEQGTATYGMTQFSDLTLDEFREKVLIPEWKDNGYPENTAEVEANTDIPPNWDWRQHNAVTPVKNQGSCGSCWAFSTTGNIEGQWAIKKGKLLSLSEQELVDCDKLDQGCGGGLPSNAYREIERMGGLESERDYPYDGQDDHCSLKKREIEVYINDSVKIPQDEAQMAVWLQKNGPISIGINAMMMQFYWGGIAHPWKIFCNPDKLNHGVLIVGYGVEGTKPYWIIKNSWGPNWGEHGYYRIYRGAGVCGLNRMATSAIVY